MPTLFLIRPAPLSETECSLLPVGCFPISSDDPRFLERKIVAQARLKAPLPLLLKMAFAMGKAVPDASFGFEEGFAHEQEAFAEAEPDSANETSVEEAEFEEVSEEQTILQWHEYVEKGDPDRGLHVLEGSLPITQEDQIIIGQLFASKDPEKMLFVCRAAQRFQWKSMALKLRVGLRHEDPRVRCAVLKAIGNLAGPSLSPVVQLCTRDSEESVRNAAIKALRKLKRR